MQKYIGYLVLFCLFGSFMNSDVHGQEANYDESKVPAYTLPPILKFQEGSTVSKSADWKRRRQEIVGLFAKHVYGRMPDLGQQNSSWKLDREFTMEIHNADESKLPPLNLTARCKEVVLLLRGKEPNLVVPVRVLIILPPQERNKSKPVPVFLGYNFGGNHTIHRSPKITCDMVWDRDPSGTENRIRTQANSETRGRDAARWSIDLILQQGFGLVTLYYEDVDPDFDDGFKNGVHSLFPGLQNFSDNWASIGAWAWGLHRVMDYLEADSDIDADRVALLGHSRLGKTALWAGATDERFAVVVSNNSGCGGAALARRAFGETVARINTVFPHWFCKQHRNYNGKESNLPVDQHMLLAAIAPRALYVASAEKDRWADPRGEFLSTFHSSKAWSLFGMKGLDIDSDKMPTTDQPTIGDAVGYHIRSGKHDVKRFDWQQYIKFAKQQF